MDKVLSFVAQNLHWTLAAFAIFAGAIAWLASVLLAVLASHRRGGPSCAVGTAVLQGIVTAYLGALIVRQVGRASPADDDDFVRVIAAFLALLVLIPAGACLWAAIRGIRSYERGGSDINVVTWAIRSIVIGLAITFVGTLVVIRAAAHGEAYEIATAVSVDLRSLKHYNTFPAAHFAAQIVPGTTNRTEARRTMRFFRARYRCEDSRPRYLAGGGGSNAEKYLYLSNDPDTAQMAIVWYDEHDIVISRHVPYDSDYRVRLKDCELF
jgi:hypothetical protein